MNTIPGIRIKACITEDDPLNYNLLKDLLEDNFPEVEVLGIATSVGEGRIFLRNHRIDLLFLDIELPDGTGFDLLSSMNEVNFEVIVTTSHSRYALDAIKKSALDYLLKPVVLSDLDAAICRFRRKFQASALESASDPAASSRFQRIPLPTSEGLTFVSTDDIVRLQAERAYSLFFLQDGKKIMVSKSMSEFEERLTARHFFRTHNSHIINLRLISRYVRGDGGHVVMADGAVVPVSRHHKESFLKAIGTL